MHRRFTISLLPLLTILTACSDEVVIDSNAACEIREQVRIAAAPEGWAPDVFAEYELHVLGDLVLFTFDDRDDPERAYWRLDRCTGAAVPFPSLTPGLANPYVVNTPAGRVLYANKGYAYYLVDRLDVAGDDPPRKLADLPEANFIDFNVCNVLADLPYACYSREGDIYTHTGDPANPALRVTYDAVSSFAYPGGVLHADRDGNLRLADPFTGASELLLADAQFLEIVDVGPYVSPINETGPIVDPAASPADARVIWQPIDEPTLYLRRVGDGVDIPLAVDPALTAAPVYIWPPNGNVVLFRDEDYRRVVAAVRADTGAALAVPEHTDVDLALDNALSLTTAGPANPYHVIWEPLTGALHTWYRGSHPHPDIWAYNGSSVDYFLRETEDPLTGSLWRIDLASGESRQLLPLVSPWRQPVTERIYMDRFETEPEQTLMPRGQRYDVQYLDIETGELTPIVEAAADAEGVREEGVIYLDVNGPDPGVWVAPLP